jgi:hypothetical protein
MDRRHPAGADLAVKGVAADPTGLRGTTSAAAHAAHDHGFIVPRAIRRAAGFSRSAC